MGQPLPNVKKIYYGNIFLKILKEYWTDIRIISLLLSQQIFGLTICPVFGQYLFSQQSKLIFALTIGLTFAKC